MPPPVRQVFPPTPTPPLGSPQRSAHTRWEPRNKNKARKAVEGKLLRISRAVLDVFRFGEEADGGDMFSAAAKQRNLSPSPDHKNSPRRSPCTASATA